MYLEHALAGCWVEVSLASRCGGLRAAMEACEVPRAINAGDVVCSTPPLPHS